MRLRFHTLLVLWVLAALTACGEMDAGNTPVTITLSIPSALNKSFAPVPESVRRVELRVTDAGDADVISPIAQEVNAGQNVIFQLEVPSGPERTFMVIAQDAQGAARFEGRSDPLDLQPNLPATLTIQMQSVATPTPTPDNRAPTAVGINRSQTITNTTDVAVTLDGSASSDPDGDPITFKWVQTEGPSVTLSDPNAAITQFTVDATFGVTLVFQLTVSDGSLSSTASATVTLSPVQKFGLKLEADNMREVGADGTVVFPHTITNTGNGLDTFSLSATNLTGVNDDFDFSTIEIFLDADSDGVPDTTTPITDTGSLSPGQTFSFLVVATVPTTGTAALILTATSGLAPSLVASNTDTAI